VGAFGSVGEDPRCDVTRAPAAMSGSAGRPMAMGDGRMARERAAQVTVMQVSSAGEWHMERRHVAWPAMGVGHNAATRRSAVGGGGWMSNHAASGAGRISI
jgi:hypothetical protein